MQQQKDDGNYKVYDHDWDSSARAGYEDRPVFQTQQQFKPRAPERGSPLMRSVGAFAIVLAMCWGAYLVTSQGDLDIILKQNHGPLFILVVGVIASVLGKFVR